MSDEASIETDPGWMEDVTFNVDTCNSDIQKHMDSRKDEPPSDNRFISLWIERFQNEDDKSDIENQRNENKFMEHVPENLSVRFSKQAERTNTSRNQARSRKRTQR